MNTASTSIPLLQNKHAVIFGAGGAVGAAVAKEFAAHGATVFLSGRTRNTVEMEEIVEALAHHPILSMWTKEMPK